jgi:hypothetical protein
MYIPTTLAEVVNMHIILFYFPTLNTIIILLTPHKDKIVFNVGDICKACLALVTAT